MSKILVYYIDSDNIDRDSRYETQEDAITAKEVEIKGKFPWVYNILVLVSYEGKGDRVEVLDMSLPPPPTGYVHPFMSNPPAFPPTHVPPGPTWTAVGMPLFHGTAPNDLTSGQQQDMTHR